MSSNRWVPDSGGNREAHFLGGLHQGGVKSQELHATFKHATNHSPALSGRGEVDRVVGSEGKPLGQVPGILENLLQKFHRLDGLVPVVVQAAQVAWKVRGREAPKVRATS